MAGFLHRSAAEVKTKKLKRKPTMDWFLPGLVVVLAGMVYQVIVLVLDHPDSTAANGMIISLIIMLIGLAWMFHVAFEVKLNSSELPDQH